MKKVAILTWLNNGNYGSILQAYALQSFIKQNGYEVEDIDYNATTKERLINWAKNRNSLSLFKEKFDAKFARRKCKNPSKFIERDKLFANFKKQYIKTTKTYTTPKELNELIGKYDAYICGSDQIWSPKLMNPIFYYSFLPNNSIKIAYAPSFGVSKIEGRKKKQIKNLLSSFNRISIREDNGRKILKDILENDYPVVLDPTLLIDKEEWKSISVMPKEKEKYILCYFLTPNTNYIKKVRKFAHERNLKVKIITTPVGPFNTGFDEIIDAGPSEWLGYINSAEYVFTDSFHGCIFSLIFNKDFYLFKRFSDKSKSSQNSRIYNIANIFNFKDRIIDENSNLNIIKKIEYCSLEKTISNENIKSKEWILDSLSIMNNTCLEDESKCYGCGACSIICPKKCIKMVENERGFLVPKVDKKDCINCGLCEKSCPFKKECNLLEINKVYAAKSKSNDVIKKSTSGGLFYEIALSFLEIGIVVGAAYDENMVVKHVIVENKKDLNKILGSKYVQSNSFDVFDEIKKMLNNGLNVLYSGTGCQIAGLKCFLKKNYDNLYTVEIACHGVPSPGLFRIYIKYLENKYKCRITNFRFRTKEEHKIGEHYKFHVQFENGKVVKKFSNIDPYYGSFLDGYSLRKTCYDCQYKGKKRIGDILLSDYWGIEKSVPNFDNNNGVSAVFICSDKGLYLFDRIKKVLDYTESTFDKATKYNPSILYPEKKKKNNYFEIISIFDNEGIIDSIVVKNKPKKYIKNIIPEKIKKIIKKVK